MQLSHTRQERPQMEMRIRRDDDFDCRLIHATEPYLIGLVARTCRGRKGSQVDASGNEDLANRLVQEWHEEPLRASLIIWDMEIPKWMASQLNRWATGSRMQQSLRASQAKQVVYLRKGRFADEVILKRLLSRVALRVAETGAEKQDAQRMLPDHLMVRYTTWSSFNGFANLCIKRLTKHTQRETRRQVGRMLMQLEAIPAWAPLVMSLKVRLRAIRGMERGMELASSKEEIGG